MFMEHNCGCNVASIPCFGVVHSHPAKGLVQKAHAIIRLLNISDPAAARIRQMLVALLQACHTQHTDASCCCLRAGLRSSVSPKCRRRRLVLGVSAAVQFPYVTHEAEAVLGIKTPLGWCVCFCLHAATAHCGGRTRTRILVAAA